MSIFTSNFSERELVEVALGYKTAARIKALGYTQAEFVKVFNEKTGERLSLYAFNDCIHDRKTQSDLRRSRVQAKVNKILDDLERGNNDG